MTEIKYNSRNTDWGLMDSLIITDETIQQKSCPINHNGFNMKPSKKNYDGNLIEFNLDMSDWHKFTASNLEKYLEEILDFFRITNHKIDQEPWKEYKSVYENEFQKINTIIENSKKYQKNYERAHLKETKKKHNC